MDVLIKNNTNHTLTIDPRVHGDAGLDWDSILANSVATFSMVDVETGCYAIANRPADIVVGGVAVGDDSQATPLTCAGDNSTSRLSYTFRSRETKKSGLFRGTFQVTSLVDGSVLAVPATKDIQVFVLGSPVSAPRPFTGMPEVIIVPPPAPVTTYPMYFGASTMLPASMVNAMTAGPLTPQALLQLGMYVENHTSRLATKTFDCSNGEYVYIMWPVNFGVDKPLAYSPVDFRLFSFMFLTPVTIRDASGATKDYILLNTSVQYSSAFYLRLIS